MSAHWDEHGFGFWALGSRELSSQGRFLGFIGVALEELISIIHPHNKRSQRLAAKLGMSVARQVHNPVLDREVDVWRIAR